MVLLCTEGLLLPQEGREREEGGGKAKKVISRKGRSDREKKRSYVKPLGWVLTNLAISTNLIIIICVLEMRQLSLQEVK